jgi:hypothetical protein
MSLEKNPHKEITTSKVEKKFSPSALNWFRKNIPSYYNRIIDGLIIVGSMVSYNVALSQDGIKKSRESAKTLEYHVMEIIKQDMHLGSLKEGGFIEKKFSFYSPGAGKNGFAQRIGFVRTDGKSIFIKFIHNGNDLNLRGDNIDSKTRYWYDKNADGIPEIEIEVDGVVGMSASE